jgi:hypothetical protein
LPDFSANSMAVHASKVPSAFGPFWACAGAASDSAIAADAQMDRKQENDADK